VSTDGHHGADFASVAHARMDALEARRELSGILEELAAKADVKERVGRQLRAHKREVTIAAVATVAAIIGVVLWRWRH
jgi:hypothetical protein